jgi:hypothetical protein
VSVFFGFHCSGSMAPKSRSAVVWSKPHDGDVAHRETILHDDMDRSMRLLVAADRRTRTAMRLGDVYDGENASVR